MEWLIAAVTATPSPSPVIIKELQTVVQQVPQTPPAVLELLQLLAVMGAAWVTSIVHQLLGSKLLKNLSDTARSNINRLVLTAYSTAGALAFAHLTGGLSFNGDDMVRFAEGFLLLMGSAVGRYELFKFVTTVTSKPAETVPAQLATDEEAPA